MKLSKHLLPFLICSLVHIGGHALGAELVHTFTRPFLMPLLAVYFWSTSPKTPLNKFVYAALFFSFLGDSLLIFSEKNELYFISGLIGFLIAHVVYIIINLNFVNDGGAKLVFKWPATMFIILGLVMFSFLKPTLGDMAIPVAVYTSVICIMGITAFGRKGRTNSDDFLWVLMGAVFFVISDSLLAINKFSSPINYAGVWVMLTYLTGQFLLVEGYKRFILGLKKG